MDDTTSKIPRVSVKEVLCCGDSVLYSSSESGVRDLPGGHVEFGETTRETLARELREELGYELKLTPRLLDVSTYINGDKTAHRVYIVYLVLLGEMTPFTHLEEPDTTKLVWLHKDEIKDQEFLPEMERLLLKALTV